MKYLLYKKRGFRFRYLSQKAFWTRVGYKTRKKKFLGLKSNRIILSWRQLDKHF